jgi:hypothetical protein
VAASDTLDFRGGHCYRAASPPGSVERAHKNLTTLVYATCLGVLGAGVGSSPITMLLPARDWPAVILDGYEVQGIE